MSAGPGEGSPRRRTSGRRCRDFSRPSRAEVSARAGAFRSSSRGLTRLGRARFGRGKRFDPRVHTRSPAHHPTRAEGSNRGHVQARARQRSRMRRPRLPWGPHPAALTRVPPSPTNSVGQGVHFGSGLRRGQARCVGRRPPSPTLPRKQRGGREPVECAGPAGAHFRSPPPCAAGAGGRGLPRYAPAAGRTRRRGEGELAAGTPPG